VLAGQNVQGCKTHPYWQNAKELKMALSVNTNIGAMVALQNLSKTNMMLAETQSRIATGRKVDSVKDDSSTWTIAQNIRGDLSAQNAVDKSLGRAKSTLDLAISAGESISDLLTRARELTAQAADFGIDTTTRDALARDFTNLMKQVDSQVQSSEYNGTNMLKNNPDGIGAILSVNADSSADRFSVQGADMRSSSYNAATQYNAVSIANVNRAATNLNGTINTNSVGSANADSLASLMSKRNLTGAVGATAGGGVQIAAQLNTSYGATGFAAGAGGNTYFDSSTGNINIRLATGMTNASTGNASAAVVGQNYDAATGIVRFTLGATTFQAQAQAGLADDAQIALKADQFTAVATGAAATAANNTGTIAVSTQYIGANALTAGGVDLTTFNGRMSGTAIIDNYQTKVKNQLGSWGSSSRQLDMQISYSSKLRDAWDTGVGGMVDADLAHESAKLQSLQVRQQLGTQALSLANQAPQALLSLFR
jgi:flagellin